MKKIVDRLFRLLIGTATAQLAGAIFRRIWKAASGDEQTPLATDPQRSVTEIVLGGLVQGAIFGEIQALLSRGGASGMERLTGERPGT